MWLLLLHLAQADEGPLQEFELIENPYLQGPLELQLTAQGQLFTSGRAEGTLLAELGLVEGTQIGVAWSGDSFELEAGVLLFRSDRTRVALLGGVEWSNWTYDGVETLLDVSFGTGPIEFVAEAGVEFGEDIEPTFGLGVMGPAGALVPFVEGRISPFGEGGGAGGLRYHPVERVELGLAVRAERQEEAWLTGVGGQLTVELGGKEDDDE
ncbi:MAG: hypothetical protein AAGA48_18870 [Myxococcota bacterium]